LFILTASFVAPLLGTVKAPALGRPPNAAPALSTTASFVAPLLGMGKPPNAAAL
jgi:hypothetical protein